MKFPTVQNLPEKVKNPDLIKSVRKRNRENRKRHISFFGLDFLNIKLGLISSELNFALENLHCFYKENGAALRKVAKL